jgi:hypothetical protein
MNMKTEPAAAPRFESNGFYERLISIRRTDRKTFDGFSIPTRLALAEYERQKRQHETEQAIKADAPQS